MPDEARITRARLALPASLLILALAGSSAPAAPAAAAPPGCGRLDALSVTPEEQSLTIGDGPAVLEATATDGCGEPLGDVVVIARVTGASSAFTPPLWDHTGSDGSVELSYEGGLTGPDEIALRAHQLGASPPGPPATRTAQARVFWGCAELVCAPTQETVLANLGDPGPPEDDALILDAEYHAEDLGVTLAEAIVHLTLQPMIGFYEEIAATHEPDIFAGLSIAYHPYRVEVYSVDATTTSFHELALEHGFAEVLPLLRVVPATYTMAELEEAARHFLGGAPAVSFGLDIEDPVNRIELIAENAADAAVLQAAVLSGQLLPPEAFIVHDDGVLSTPDDALWAGKAFDDPNPCTTGYSVYHTRTGRRGVSTAGHCDDAASFQGTELPFAGERFGGSADWQWHRTPGIADRPRARDHSADGWRRVTRWLPRENQARNSRVCKWGRTTKRTCGLIKGKRYAEQPSHPGATPDRSEPTWIRVVGEKGEKLRDGGDSGGPWYVGSTAYGIHSAGRMTKEGTFLDHAGIYMALDYMHHTSEIRILTA